MDLNSVGTWLRKGPWRAARYACATFCIALGALLLLHAQVYVTTYVSSTASVNRAPSASLASQGLNYRFSETDLSLYERTFLLQDEGQWEQADEALGQLTDDTLLGAILANRYLHPDYQSDYSELVMWLENYADMPQASRIQTLARNKKPSGERLNSYDVPHKRLAGVGARDGMGGSASMPDEWRSGLNAWIDGDYARAASLFVRVANDSRHSKWNHSAAHFWAYRAYEQQGDRGRSAYHLRQAATSQFTLYGSIARHLLGDTQSVSLAAMPRIGDSVRNIPAVKRAAAYRALGRSSDADNELRHAYVSATMQEKRELVRVAADLELPALQLRMSQAMHRKSSTTDVSAYPMPRWLAARDVQADPALLYAISRQESAFDADARSPAGARGVMQLMPKTASYVIRSFKLDEVQLAALDSSAVRINSISTDKLNDPSVNMMIGQHYVKYLQEKSYINGNLIYLLSAYNAGPAKIIEWSKRFSDVSDPLLFVELIPYRETRHYVTQVLANYMIYDELLSGRQETASALAQGYWPLLHSDSRMYSASLKHLQ